MQVITRKALFDKMQQQYLPSFQSKLDYPENYLLMCEIIPLEKLS